MPIRSFGCTLKSFGLHPRGRRTSYAIAPESYAYYQGADISLQAAYLAHGIAETQPFIDGNKRVALVAMLLFLRLNGYFPEQVSQTERADRILKLRS